MSDPQTGSSLAGVRILVAEDEYAIAMFVTDYLEMQGAEVVGPAGNLEALDTLVDSTAIHAALLDINLGGELVYPLADRLAMAGVPFVLTSGYDGDLPPRFNGRPHCSKPYRLEELRGALCAALAGRGAARP